MGSDELESLARAEGLVRSGRLDDARRLAIGWLEQHGGDASDGAWERALALLAKVADAWRMPLVTPLGRAAVAPRDAKELGTLGKALLVEGEAELASVVLARAHLLAPGNELWLTEQVAALELLGRNAEAVAVIEASVAHQKGAASFLLNYLRAFNRALAGDLAGVASDLETLTTASEADVFLKRRLTNLMARAEAVAGVTALDANDLRGWHFVLTGSLLLHLGPASEGRGGRYAELKDNETLLREVIVRLETVLEALGVMPPSLLVLDGLESHVVGRAAGNLLRRPVDFVSLPIEQAGRAGAALVVAYDLGSFRPELLESLRQRTETLPYLFAHAACSAREQCVTPDFVGLLYERRVSTAWNRHLFEARNERVPTNDELALASQIIEADTLESMLEDQGELVALAVVAEAAGVLPAAQSERSRLWVGSPVARLSA